MRLTLTLLSGLVVQLLLEAESMPAEPPPDWFGQLATEGCHLATDETIDCEVESDIWRLGRDTLVRESERSCGSDSALTSSGWRRRARSRANSWPDSASRDAVVRHIR